MKRKIALAATAVLMTAALTACSSADKKEETASSVSEPKISTGKISTGNVTVYDYGNIKLHAYATGDALGDEAYILENETELVGIELPSFTENLDSWQEYIKELNKPMENIFVSSHATGESYLDGVNVYATEKAKESIESGSVFATTQGLYETFGDDFHGGNDMVQVTNTVSEGVINIAGIDFNVINNGDTYDIEIPEINAIYTHMLGKTTHSILVSADGMNSMLNTLNNYKDNGYNMILSAHSEPEGQDAVEEKIAYVEKAKELYSECKTADEFISEMKKAYPNYSGENYLEMSAGYLYQ